MKVIRTDVFDFVVNVSPDELETLIFESDKQGNEPKDVLALIIVRGLDELNRAL